MKQVQKRQPSERGSTAVIVGIVIAVLVGFAGLGVDVGNLVYTKIRLQNSADTAALSAIKDIEERVAIARSIVANNNFNPDEISFSVQRGAWDAASDTFALDETEGNSVRVELGEDVPLHFIKVIPGVPEKAPVFARATATLKKAGAIVQLGATLLAIQSEQGELLDALLGGLLGTTLDLKAVGWEGLANANINLVDFLKVGKVQLSAGTADQLLNTDATLLEILNVMLDALHADETTAYASLSLLRDQILAANVPAIHLPLRVGDLLQLDTNDGALAVANVNLLSMVTSAIQLFNHDSAVLAETGVNLPGLANVALKAKVVESPVIKVMQEGDTIHSAGLRLYLNAELLSILGKLVKLPLYLEGGAGTAELTGMTTDDIDLDVTVSALDLYIGSVNENLFFSDSAIDAGSFTEETILNVIGLIKVNALAAASATGAQETVTLVPGETATVGGSAGAATSNLLNSLTDNLVLSADVLGLGLDVGGLLTTLLGDITASILSPLLQGLLDPVTALTGIQPGVADVTFIDFAYDAVLVD